MDPYGGPATQMVLASQAIFLTSQWFAEQGFAVVVADGRGTPGRGPAWERTVAGDLARLAVEDQVEALRAAAARWAGPDLDRRGGGGRARHAGRRARLGAHRRRRPRPPGGRGSGRGAAGRRGPVRRPGPGPGGDQGVVVRRVPGRAGRGAAARRVPRRGVGRPG